MEFDNSFEVPLPPAQAFAVLKDIPRIVPCMPGAELTEIVDPQNYKGKVSVRLGPVALAFSGRIEFESIDEASHSARLKAQGSDAKGRGAADAVASFHIELSLSGAVAQYGRGVGMIQATASQIIGQFAANLRAQLAETPPMPGATLRRASELMAPVDSAAVPPRPISGLSLIARVVWSRIIALFDKGRT